MVTGSRSTLQTRDFFTLSFGTGKCSSSRVLPMPLGNIFGYRGERFSSYPFTPWTNQFCHSSSYSSMTCFAHHTQGVCCRINFLRLRYSSAGCPLYIVPVKSLDADGIIRCGSMRSNGAGCRYSAGIFGSRVHTGTIEGPLLLYADA